MARSTSSLLHPTPSPIGDGLPKLSLKASGFEPLRLAVALTKPRSSSVFHGRPFLGSSGSPDGDLGDTQRRRGSGSRLGAADERSELGLDAEEAAARGRPFGGMSAGGSRLASRPCCHLTFSRRIHPRPCRFAVECSVISFDVRIVAIVSTRWGVASLRVALLIGASSGEGTLPPATWSHALRRG